MPAWRHTAGLIGRHHERAELNQLVDAVGRAGESRALVLHGEAGVGKTALLDYLAGHSAGCRVARAAGVQSEMQLAFAGLHQLCAPMLHRLEVLPPPQRGALRTAFGLTAGPAPDRLLLGLAVLSLLSHVAEEQPLVCLVDDQQWLDHASAQVLAFVARRLGAESVGLVFAARVPGGELDGLPELLVRALPEGDARELLDAVLTGPIDRRVRDQIVAETRGNPLALLELPRGLTVAELAGGFGLPSVSLAGTIEENFRRRVGALPPRSRLLLLLAAADPTGDPALVFRAAVRLGIGADTSVTEGQSGIDADALAAAADAGLAEFHTRVRFRHPLARSAAYQSATAEERRSAHRALAEATDQRLDPDRRAWHRAQAATGPDEEVADELERSAGRARGRGGLGAAAAFLKQAATLTLDPEHRAERALAAAQAKIQAGAFEVARDLLAMAESGPVSELRRARGDMMRAQLAYVTNRGSDAPPLLLKAARRLESVDGGLSRATYLDALSAAIFAGHLAGPGGQVTEVARAAAAAPSAHRPCARDLLLEGLVAQHIDGYAAGVPILRNALRDFGVAMSDEEELHWLWLASVAAMRVWDDDRWDALTARHVQLARETGMLSELPLALISRASMLLFAGDLAGAASLAEEARIAEEATGANLAPYGTLGLAALRGDHARTSALIDATVENMTKRGQGIGVTFAEWANAVLNNGLGRHHDALAASATDRASTDAPGTSFWPSVELVEAAARSGAIDIATNAHRRLTEMTSASGTNWALGTQVRSQALLCEGERAEQLYRESIARLAQTRIRADLARAHLLYGEWLRRERRRGEAREQLRIAHSMLETMGMAAFAERAGRELRATGETARKRADAVRHERLTAQEAQIARLARDGLSNPEIGTRLFISAHTVQYHLRKVFAKLGINSRSQLDRVLPHEFGSSGN